MVVTSTSVTIIVRIREYGKLRGLSVEIWLTSICVAVKITTPEIENSVEKNAGKQKNS